MIRRSVWRVGFVVLLAAYPARADEKADVRTILDRAIDFSGGREAPARYEQPFLRSVEGTAMGAGGAEPFEMTITTVFPEKERRHQTSKTGRIWESVFDGERGWQKTTVPAARPAGRASIRAAGGGPEMNAMTVQATRDRLYGQWLGTLLPLDDEAFGLSLAEEITIDERQAVGIRISHDDRPDVQLYFDKETFALVKLVRQLNGRTWEEHYDDYGELDGLVYAKKLVQYVDGNRVTEMQTTELKFLDSVEENTFEQP